MKNVLDFKLVRKLEECGVYENIYNCYGCYNEEFKKKWFEDEDNEEIIEEVKRKVGGNWKELIEDYIDYINSDNLKMMVVEVEEINDGDLIKISNGDVERVWINCNIDDDGFVVFGIGNLIDSLDKEESREYLDSEGMEKVSYVNDERFEGINLELGKEVFLGFDNGDLVILVR